MDQFGADILEKNKFLSEIAFSEAGSNSSYNLPPVVKVSSLMTYKSLRREKANLKLAFLVPVKGNFSRWLALNHTISQMNYEYFANRQNVLSSYNEFKSGQKLMLNESSVVQFEHFTDDNLYINTKSTKYSSNLSIGIKLSKVLSLQPANPNSKLSPQNKVLEDLRKIQIPLLDKVLGIKTAGNYQFFKKSIVLVSGIGETSRFVENIWIKKKPLRELFKWGYIHDGEGELLFDNKSGAHPSLIITHQTDEVLKLLQNEKDSIGAVYFDGIHFATNNLQVFDKISETGIPLIVAADFFESEQLSYLEDREFNLWKWNRKYLESVLPERNEKESPFHFFNGVCENYAQSEIKTEVCESENLSSCFGQLHSLNKLLEHEADTSLLVRTVSLANRLSRLVTIPDLTTFKTFRSEIAILSDQFDSRRIWMTDVAINAFTVALNSLKLFVEELNKGSNPKNDRLLQILEKSKSSQNLVILPDDHEVTPFKIEISDAGYSIIACTPQDFNSRLLNHKNLNIIICGWLGRYKMFRILHCFYSAKITLIAYPFEQKYLQSARRKWEKYSESQPNNERFDKLLGFSLDDLLEVDSDFQVNQNDDFRDSNDNETSDIFQFESGIDDAIYSGYRKVSSDGETLKARLVELSDDRYLFATDGHRFYKVEAGSSESYNVKSVKAEDLRLYDHLIFTHTDKDVLKDLVKQNLQAKEYQKIETHITEWKNALYDYYESLDSDIEVLIKEFKAAGCERHAQTIKSWLFDSNRLGPQMEEDFEIIAKITDSQFLINNSKEIFSSIRQMRGYLISASAQLTKMMMSGLSSIKDESLLSNSAVLNLEGFEEIIILQILHLGRPEDVDYRFTNRLYEKGKEQWQE